MAVSYSNLVSRVKQQLLGYTKDQAAISYLTSAITTTSQLTFTADTSTVRNISRGLMEIDDELMLVQSIDATSGTVTTIGNALPIGRGVEGTTATTHVSGSMITNDPRFPTQRIKEAINDSINGVYPDLWVFGQHEFPYIAARYEYPIPVEAEDVYKVVANTIGPSAVWKPMTAWRFNAMASTTAGQVKPTPTPTGKSIIVSTGNNFVVPGRNIRVSYTKKPNTLTNNSDDFETVTGLPERVIDVIVYGACWRLIPAYEAARLQQQAVEATERAPLVASGNASQASQYFMNLYNMRLQIERMRLQRLFDSYQTFN